MDKEKAKNLGIDQVVEELTTTKDGLTDSQAQIRLKKNGLNVLKTHNKHRGLKLLIKQFKSPLVYLLIVASALAYAVGDRNDGIVITVILAVNTGLGFFQEYRSEKAIEKLEKLVDRDVLVIRDNKQLLISDKNLVLGDVVILREGDVVPADVKLFSIDDLTVNESQLTGESVPVTKTISGSGCLVFAGSVIEQGEGKGVIYATDSKTELGKIAHLSDATTRTTQFEKSLSSFSSFLVKAVFLMLLGVFVLKLLISHSTSTSQLILFVLALSIAVVPEAMLVVVAVTLSRGALSLAKRHVITKTLSAVEDLGNINVLCTDKTGTLTKNELTIKSITADDPELYQTLAIVALESTDEKRRKFQSSFDKAYEEYVSDKIQQAATKYKRLKELPFDPSARRRRVIAALGSKTYLIEIGSTETLLNITSCKKASEYIKTVKEDGKLGLRHLAIAYKEIDYNSDSFDILKHEKDLKFVGFCSLEDPLRPSASSTIKLAEKLGVAIKILSGDSREVTEYVAREVGLVTKTQTVLTGDEIDQMSDDRLSEELKSSNAFARLNPEQKYRIIKLLKLHGNVVGYQGDGINDAPALKLADVAIAVNNATDVAQDSADILLLRTDIGVIVNGIKYGREIFANINKYIRFTFVSNWGNFFALSALYLLLNTNLPILPVQLLFLSLLTELPCIAIATDNVDKGELTSPSKFNVHALMFISIFLGSLTAVFEIMYYAIIKQQTPFIASTGLYFFLSFTALIVIFTIRNRDHFWKAPRLSAPMIASFALVTAIIIAVVYIPLTKRVLHFSGFSLELFAGVVAMTIVYFVIMDTVKVWFYRTPIGKTLH